MKDYYAEQLVKRNDSLKTSLAKLGFILLIILSIAGVTKNTLWIFVTAALVMFGIFFFWRLDIEYEYLFINDELTIDKVMAKSKRRTVFRIHIRDVELVAPIESGEARPYQKIKKKDFTSVKKDSQVYLMIISEDEGCVGITFEPNMEILTGIRNYDPQKVILDIN